MASGWSEKVAADRSEGGEVTSTYVHRNACACFLRICHTICDEIKMPSDY